MTAGTCFIVGVGPGDPELLTLKAARIIAASPVVASFARRGAAGHARRIAAAHIAADAREERLDYPVTTELPVAHPDYAPCMAAFYAASAARLAQHLDAGRDVALLCEGDPFFYGSAMHLFDRLDGYAREIVPGVTGMSGCWARARLPMAQGDDGLTVLSGTLDAARLTARLRAADAAVVMKLGRNLAKVRAAITDAGLLERAVYVERGTMDGERIRKLAELGDIAAPYFALILIPGRRRAR
jgi:precorrin-2/cobalt-factor-2 C20-methyltransferase